MIFPKEVRRQGGGEKANEQAKQDIKESKAS
jgi:hypothetical protein